MCYFKYGYMDGSVIVGYLFKDIIYLINMIGIIIGLGFIFFVFGCMNNNISNFINVDGLVGFGIGFLLFLS